MENLLSLFEGLDVKYLYAAVAILAISGVLSLIKKGIKLGLTILVIAALLTYGGGEIKKLQDRYALHIDGSEISFMVQDKNYNIDLSSVKEVIAEESGAGKVKVEFTTSEGKNWIELNKKVFDYIKKQANKYDIKITEK